MPASDDLKDSNCNTWKKEGHRPICLMNTYPSDEFPCRVSRYSWKVAKNWVSLGNASRIHLCNTKQYKCSTCTVVSVCQPVLRLRQSSSPWQVYMPTQASSGILLRSSNTVDIHRQTNPKHTSLDLERATQHNFVATFRSDMDNFRCTIVLYGVILRMNDSFNKIYWNHIYDSIHERERSIVEGGMKLTNGHFY